MKSIYQPAEDSFLLANSLKKYLKDKSLSLEILDMGSGSGIQAQTCKNLGFKNILTADINPEAIKELKKQGFKTIKTNLFSKLKGRLREGNRRCPRYNLIIFNPPYLPEHKHDKEPDTTAGKKGNETIIEFLKQSKNHLTEQGQILLLFSSLSKPIEIKKQAKELGYKLKLLDKKRIFFEELFVYLLW